MAVKLNVVGRVVGASVVLRLLLVPVVIEFTILDIVELMGCAGLVADEVLVDVVIVEPEFVIPSLTIVFARVLVVFGSFVLVDGTLIWAGVISIVEEAFVESVTVALVASVLVVVGSVAGVSVVRLVDPSFLVA